MVALFLIFIVSAASTGWNLSRFIESGHEINLVGAIICGSCCLWQLMIAGRSL